MHFLSVFLSLCLSFFRLPSPHFLILFYIVNAMFYTGRSDFNNNLKPRHHDLALTAKRLSLTETSLPE